LLDTYVHDFGKIIWEGKVGHNLEKKQDKNKKDAPGKRFKKFHQIKHQNNFLERVLCSSDYIRWYL